MKKIITFCLVILLFSTTSLYLENSKAIVYNGDTFYVGGTGFGNFSNIQGAIDNASNGDTIFVFNGTYYENILLNKSIKLISADKNITIIDGNMKGDVIRITSDNVTFSGFTVINGGRPYLSFFEGGGIRLDSSSYSTISNNIVKENNMYGIVVIENTSSHNTIVNNTISRNGRSNYKTRSYFNIATIHSPYNTIANNIIENALGVGLVICYWSFNTTVYGNIIRNNKMGGIRGRHFFGNNIYENTIENNSLFGIRILNESANNRIERNNFYRNTPLDAFFTISSTSLSNHWDGNYWSRSRIFPKIIFGYLRPNMNSMLGIPWFDFDQNPSSEPIDIS